MTSHCFLTPKTIGFAVCILHCPIGVLGTLQNYDGDENEDVQKAIGLTTRITLFGHFFAVPKQLRREMTKC